METPGAMQRRPARPCRDPARGSGPVRAAPCERPRASDAAAQAGPMSRDADARALRKGPGARPVPGSARRTARTRGGGRDQPR